MSSISEILGYSITNGVNASDLSMYLEFLQAYKNSILNDDTDSDKIPEIKDEIVGIIKDGQVQTWCQIKF